MRLSELLRSRVVTTEGRVLGHVHDVLLVQDGPVVGEWGAAFRLHALAIGPGSVGTRLGYGTGAVVGPALVRKLLARPVVLVPWTAVRSRDDGVLTVDAAAVSDAD
jgi:hypothetical protein